MKWIVKTHASESGRYYFCLFLVLINKDFIGNEISCCASGKPADCGGIEDQKKSAGLGIFFGLDAFLQNGDIMKKIGLDAGWGGKTFIIEVSAFFSIQSNPYFIVCNIQIFELYQKMLRFCRLLEDSQKFNS